MAIGDSLQKAHDRIRNVDTIITGHSAQMTWAELNEYASFNREFLNDVRTAKQAGQTVADVAGSWKIPAKYAGYTAPMPDRLKDNIQVVYRRAEGRFALMRTIPGRITKVMGLVVAGGRAGS